MVPKNSPNKFHFYVFIAIEILFIIVCISVKKPQIITIPFARDEPDYVANSILLDHFRHYNSGDIYWNQTIAYDQPHLYHYLSGIFLENFYHQPIDLTLKKSDLINKPEHPYIEYGVTGMNKLLTNPAIRSYQSAYQVILSARTLSFYFYLLSGIIFIFIFYLLNIVGFSLLFLLIYLSPFAFSISIYAQADGLLMLTFALCTLLSILYLKIPKKHLLMAVLIGINCGLSLSTKLNGGITIITGILCVLSSYDYGKKHQLKRCLKDIVILSVLVTTVFIILNPYLYHHTFQNIAQMFQFRIGQSETFRTVFPEQSFSQNYFTKFISFSKLLYTYTKLSPSLSALLVLSTLITSLALVGSYLLDKIRLPKTQFFILLNSLSTLIFIFIYIPMNWNRYFLPALIEDIILLCLECHIVFQLFYKKSSIKKILS